LVTDRFEPDRHCCRGEEGEKRGKGKKLARSPIHPVSGEGARSASLDEGGGEGEKRKKGGGKRKRRGGDPSFVNLNDIDRGKGKIGGGEKR